MEYTYATVVIESKYQELAREKYPDYFITGLSETGELPITHYVTSGGFDNVELEDMTNSIDWPKTILFGLNIDSHLSKLNLKICNEQNQ